jgi:hypothetical protein
MIWWVDAGVINKLLFVYSVYCALSRFGILSWNKLWSVVVVGWLRLLG